MDGDLSNTDSSLNSLSVGISLSEDDMTLKYSIVKYDKKGLPYHVRLGINNWSAYGQINSILKPSSKYLIKLTLEKPLAQKDYNFEVGLVHQTNIKNSNYRFLNSIRFKPPKQSEVFNGQKCLGEEGEEVEQVQIEVQICLEQNIFKYFRVFPSYAQIEVKNIQQLNSKEKWYLSFFQYFANCRVILNSFLEIQGDFPIINQLQ